MNDNIIAGIIVTVVSVGPGRVKIGIEAPRDQDAVVVADLNFDQIDEVRSVWQFFRDRRPDQYGPLVQP